LLRIKYLAFIVDFLKNHVSDNRMAYMATGLLASDGIHLSQRGKQVFAQELAGLTDRALN